MNALFIRLRTGSRLTVFIILLMICQTGVAGSFFAKCIVLHDSIIVKVLQSKKPSVFELYPDVSQEVLLFTARGEEKKVYRLFLFNIDGELLKQTQIRSKETGLLSGFTKGDYLFEILSNDDRVGSGSITVR